MSLVLKQQSFEGPLDLLLQLIEEEQLDITTISLGQVTDQYLAYVRELEQRHLPEISDWLVIAARLILLKSRALLPAAVTDDEELDDLAAQLAEYKLYRELAGQLGDSFEAGQISFGKPASKLDFGEQFVPEGAELSALHQAFSQVVARLPEERPLPTESLEEQLTIDQCIEMVQAKLAEGPSRFEGLFAKLQNRLQMIVTFLAVLELFKQRLLRVNRDQGALMLGLRA